MCGLFGFASTNGQGPNLETLAKMAIDTESRGDHSFGFAWIDGDNRLRSYKQVGAISQNLPRLRMLADARMLIAHCRYATHGEVNIANAHPFASDGGWIAHNGIIGDHSRLVRRFDLQPQTECDSETIALLIENLRGTLLDRVERTIRHCADSHFAMLGVWKNPARLVIGKSGKHLSWSRVRRGVYFASLGRALPGKSEAIQNETLVSFTFKGGALDIQSRRLSAPACELF